MMPSRMAGSAPTQPPQPRAAVAQLCPLGVRAARRWRLGIPRARTQERRSTIHDSSRPLTTSSSAATQDATKNTRRRPRPPPSAPATRRHVGPRRAQTCRRTSAAWPG
eukprot:scaffold75700_cov38-Phaeocystis_antarctica.AAC.2